MQSVWKGVISFGLVSIPVQLFAATEEHGVSFRQIHVSDGGQIRYRRVCTLDDEEVPYDDIARGYELPDGHVVVLTDEDFARLPLVTSRAIEVLGFADADSVDPVRLSRSYYCDPTGADAKAYVLLRDALQRTGKIAMVKVALRGRESPAVLHPRDGILVLHLLLWQDEVRKPRFASLRDETPPRARELAAAEAYIHTLTGTAEPHDMVDRYQAALLELVEAKVAGRQLEQPRGPAAADNSENLMDALRRSVEQAKQDRAAPPPPRKRAVAPAPAPAPKKPPAKKPAAKKRPQKTPPHTPAPQETAPQKPAPEATAPPQPASRKPAPQETAPQRPAPRRPAPRRPAPQEIAPQETAPQETAPQKAAPTKAAAMKAVPTEQAAPEPAARTAAVKSASAGKALKGVPQKAAAGKSVPGRKVAQKSSARKAGKGR